MRIHINMENALYQNYLDNAQDEMDLKEVRSFTDTKNITHETLSIQEFHERLDSDHEFNKKWGTPNSIADQAVDILYNNYLNKEKSEFKFTRFEFLEKMRLDKDFSFKWGTLDFSNKSAIDTKGINAIEELNKQIAKTSTPSILILSMEITLNQYNEVVKSAQKLFLDKHKDYGSSSWTILRMKSVTDQIQIKAKINLNWLMIQ